MSNQAVSSGPVGFFFTNSTATVYDLSGSYQFEQQAVARGGTPLDLSLGFSVQQDAAGRLRGSGVTNVQFGTDVVSARYTVNGAVSGGGGKVTRAKFSIRWQAQDAGAGASSAFTITVQYNLEVMQGLLNGTARGRAKFGKSGSSGINTSVSAVPLPAGVDGSWNLTLDIQAPRGSGTVNLPNGRSLRGSLAGNLSARSALKRLKLAGVGGDRGTTLSLGFLPASSAMQSLSGKVLGQTVNLKSPSGGSVNQNIAQGSTSSAYAGYQACLECHTPVQQTLATTPHFQAGVECESCHGPAANHAANDYDPVSRPNIPYDGASCGTCHNGPQHPTYDEWKTSDHAEVVEDLNPPDRISSCGRCHSGSVRVNLVEGTPLPVGGANEPLGCPTCHEPHQLTGNPVQLRNPIYSTNDYFLTTTSVFTNNYNPSINLCGQCHNHRGASYTNSAAPPHPSPQYNMLLGSIGELDSGSSQYDPGSHGRFITNQCVGCHMQNSPFVSTAQPAVTGHSFAMNSYAVCAGCHGSSVNASNLVIFLSGTNIPNTTIRTNGIITIQMQTLQESLNEWATNSDWATNTNSPGKALSDTYKTLAWEYTTPGALSPPSSFPPGLTNGPMPNEQLVIPTNIWKARFNLYLVYGDGSVGVHNPNYSIELLNTAQNWVDQELRKVDQEPSP